MSIAPSSPRPHRVPSASSHSSKSKSVHPKADALAKAFIGAENELNRNIPLAKAFLMHAKEAMSLVGGDSDRFKDISARLKAVFEEGVVFRTIDRDLNLIYETAEDQKKNEESVYMLDNSDLKLMAEAEEEFEILKKELPVVTEHLTTEGQLHALLFLSNYSEVLKTLNSNFPAPRLVPNCVANTFVWEEDAQKVWKCRIVYAGGKKDTRTYSLQMVRKWEQLYQQYEAVLLEKVKKEMDNATAAGFKIHKFDNSVQQYLQNLFKAAIVPKQKTFSFYAESRGRYLVVGKSVHFCDKVTGEIRRLDFVENFGKSEIQFVSHDGSKSVAQFLPFKTLDECIVFFANQGVIDLGKGFTSDEVATFIQTVEKEKKDSEARTKVLKELHFNKLDLSISHNEVQKMFKSFYDQTTDKEMAPDEIKGRYLVRLDPQTHDDVIAYCDKKTGEFREARFRYDNTSDKTYVRNGNSRNVSKEKEELAPPFVQEYLVLLVKQGVIDADKGFTEADRDEFKKSQKS